MRRPTILCILAGVLLISAVFPASAQNPVIFTKTLIVPSSGTAKVGELVNFQLLIYNSSKMGLAEVVMNDNYDSLHLQFVEATPPPDIVDEKNGFLSWDDLTETFGQIDPGEKAAVSVTFRAIGPTFDLPAKNSASIFGEYEDQSGFETSVQEASVKIVFECAPDIHEPNDDTASATPIFLSTPLQGYICPVRDEDYFAINITKAGTYQFLLYNLPDDYDLYVLNSAGTELGSSTASNLFPEHVALNIGAATGKYFALVRAKKSNSYDKPYTIKVIRREYRTSDSGDWPPGSTIPIGGDQIPPGDADAPNMAYAYWGSVSPANMIGMAPILPDGTLIGRIKIPDDPPPGDHVVAVEVRNQIGIVESSILAGKALLPAVSMDLWVDDAWNNYPYSQKPIVNKCVYKTTYGYGETIVDVNVTGIKWNTDQNQARVKVHIENDAFGSPEWAYRREGFGGPLTLIPWTNEGGGTYSALNNDLSLGVTRHIVFRFRIPHNIATPNVIDVTGSMESTGGDVLASASIPRQIRLLNGVDSVVFINRSTLYRDFNDDDVTKLLGSIYKHSANAGGAAPHDRRADIFYVDKYRPILPITDFDNTAINYTSEANANYVAQQIKNVMTDRFQHFSSPKPFYVLIVGNDEQFPMYRMLDPYNKEKDWLTSGNGNPAMETCDNNYYLTDAFYADWSGGYISGYWKDGNTDLTIGRVIGDSAVDMKQLYEIGLTNNGGTGRAIMASVAGWELGYEPDDGRYGEIADYANVPARLGSRGMSVKNDNETPRTVDVMEPYPSNWNSSFKAAANGGMDIFFIGGHNDYKYASIPGDDFSPDDIPSKYNRFDNDNPMVFIVGCHGGLPVPNIGGWPGGAASSMVYGVIHSGARAYYGASGFSYGSPGNLHGCLWGERFLQYLFKRMTDSGTISYSIGYSHRWAQNNYAFGVGGNSNLDRKTVTEFNIFGVPWQKLDWPGGVPSTADSNGNKTHVKSPLTKFDQELQKLMIAPRTVVHLSDEIYEQSFNVNTASWSAGSLEEFDIIDIPDSEQQYIIDSPVLPMLTPYSIALPPGGQILSLNVDQMTTETIGSYNLPNVRVSPWTLEGIVLTSETDLDELYPGQIAHAREASPGNYLISVFPVRHNPTSDETIFHEDFRVTVQYSAPVPYGILDFAASAPQYSPSETPEFSANLFNMGDSVVQVTGDLTIRDKDSGFVVATQPVSVPLNEGSVYPLNISAPNPLGDGIYEATLSVASATGPSAEASDEFSVASVVISNLKATYDPMTKQASFSADAKNMTNVPGTLDLDFVLVDGEGLWVDTVSPLSEQLGAGETIQMIGTWNNDKPLTDTLTLSTASSFNGNPLNKTNGNFTPYSLSDLVDALIDHILMRKIIPVNDRPTADLNKDNLLNVGDVLKAVEESNK